MFLRTPYNYDRRAASEACSLTCEASGLTQQHFKDECDINNILRKFNVTGLLPENPLSPRYGDFSGIGDYHSALNAVRASHAEFEALPAGIRARFGNDPANLIEFMNSEENRAEAIKLGLIDPPKAVIPSDGGDNSSGSTEPEKS